MQGMRRLAFFILTIAAAGPMPANETAFLNGQVRLQDGSAPGHSVEIQLSCRGADHPIRQTMSNKNGKYYLKVERDEFNHVARALSTPSVELGNEPPASSCQVIAALAGFTSSAIDLATFTIGTDLKLPDLILTKRSAH
jgi:hypothetical protein